MPFSLGQMFGGWRRKESKLRKPKAARDEISRRGRALSAPPQYNSDISRDGVKEISDRAVLGAISKNKSDLAWEVLKSPHISEKATMLGDGRYTFKIADRANKAATKRAIEERYGVEVKSVSTINMPPKPRHRGQVLGERPGFKKAIITLKKGQTISEF